MGSNCFYLHFWCDLIYCNDGLTSVQRERLKIMKLCWISTSCGLGIQKTDLYFERILSNMTCLNIQLYLMLCVVETVWIRQDVCV